MCARFGVAIHLATLDHVFLYLMGSGCRAESVRLRPDVYLFIDENGI